MIADTGARFAAYAIDLLLLFVAGRLIAAIPDANDFISSVAILAIGGTYFIGSWSGGRRATFGQRLTHIQVGNAFDGAPLTVAQATKRWFAIGDWITLLTFIPIVGLAGALASSVWNLVLLFTTYTSPVGQGLHDRFAKTAVAQQEGGVRPVWLVLFALAAWFIVSVAWTGSGAR